MIGGSLRLLGSRQVWASIGALGFLITAGLSFYTFQSNQRQESRADADRASQAVLQSYIKDVKDLILEEKSNLATSEVHDPVREIARALTITAVRQLDGERKGILLRFLFESRLISNETKIIQLFEIDLSEADLAGFNLGDIHLTKADLTDADLGKTILIKADLSRSIFRGADPTEAVILGADLTRTDLTGAVLVGANLSGADLTDADLTDADLTGADLTGADLTRTVFDGTNLIDAVLADLRGTTVGQMELAKNLAPGSVLLGLRLPRISRQRSHPLLILGL
jgi:uncharacterized protein YjbI with pentapeptide repeats